MGGFRLIPKHFLLMRFLSLNIYMGFDFPVGEFCLSSLSTLIIESNIYRDFSFEQWSLPSLRHLQIGNIIGGTDLQRLVPNLAILGRQLRVLNITLDRSGGERVDKRYINEHDYQLMSKFWDYFPHLESLRFPLSIIISHVPPRDHPIRYLINSEAKPAHHNWPTPAIDVISAYTDALIAFCLATPGLVTVRESHNWTSGMPSAKDVGVMLPELSDTFRDMGEVDRQLRVNNIKIRFEDVNGKTLGES